MSREKRCYITPLFT